MTLSYLNLLAGLLLLVIPGYLLYAYDRLTLKKAVIALVRMGTQMAVLGACLWLLYKFDSVWLNLLWLAILVVAVAFLMVSRIDIRRVFVPACAAMFTSVLAVSAYMLFVVLRPDAPLSARWAVPVTGVLMAHVLTTNIHAVRTYFDCLRQDSQAYYTLLGNGATRLQALAPYITRAIKSLTVPAMASLSVMGLFLMPMLLSGLLIGGLEPIAAVTLFVLFIIGALAASMLSLVLTLWFSDRQVFNRHGQLKPDI